MLVTFTCSACADITMFGDVAVRLIKMMGHSGTVPSALVAEDVRPALERLQAAVNAAPQEDDGASDGDADDSAVSLQHRAMPLINLLRSADAADVDVMWDKGQ